jgi:hypothetical protein
MRLAVAALRMGISVVYCFHKNNDVARRSSFAKIPVRKVPLTAAATSVQVCMAIATYLDDFDADLETKRVLGIALERTRVSLGLVERFADGLIARRIVELAKAGERNPDLLCEGALKKLDGALFGD